MQWMEWKHYNDVDPKEWRWPNFEPAELATRGGPNAGSLKIDEASMDCLQALREKVGPMIVTSAYRDPVWNAHIGGKRNSQHLLGKAFDISMANHDPEEFVRCAKACGFNAIGYYEEQNFIHIDTRASTATWGTPWKANQFEPEVDKAATSIVKDPGIVGTGVGGAAAVPIVLDTLDRASTMPGWMGQALGAVVFLAIAGAVVYMIMKKRGRRRA